VNGLSRLRRPEDIARQRGLTIKQILPLPRNYDRAAVAAAAAAAAEPAAAEPAGAAEPAVEAGA